MSNPIRFAVLGAGRAGGGGTGRGKVFINSAAHMPNEIVMTAICDMDPVALEQWKEHGGVKTYARYEDLLSDPEIDAICVSTPVDLHAGQALLALRAGKHVLSEVTAAYTLEECWELVEAVEETGLTYMMAENYCYMREHLLIENMVQQGVFGDITFASGAYLHDCRDLLWTEEGELTWRGGVRRKFYGNTYPTHSLGPVSRWLGINQSDRFVSTATWGTPTRAIPDYAARNLPHRPEYSRTEYWPGNENAVTLLKTEKGAVAEIRVDWASPRPHNMVRHELQGTKASFTSQEHPNESLIWIQDVSPTTKTGVAESWEPLSKYYDKFEHPLWKQHMADASRAGHGGGDFFVLREFAAAVRENRLPMVDVYDAVTWSCITPLSMQSIDSGNAPVEVPNFKAKRQ